MATNPIKAKVVETTNNNTTAINRRTLTRRTRCLGFGWTNQPERSPNDGLRIATPREQVRGSLTRIQEEVQRAARGNQGNDWRGDYFVDGRRVTRIVEPAWAWTTDICDMLQFEDRIVVELEDA